LSAKRTYFAGKPALGYLRAGRDLGPLCLLRKGCASGNLHRASLMLSGWLCQAGAWWSVLLLLRSGLGFELLGITSDLEGLLRRCTTQVAPYGPAQVVPALHQESGW